MMSHIDFFVIVLNTKETDQLHKNCFVITFGCSYCDLVSGGSGGSTVVSMLTSAVISPLFLYI